MEFVDRRDAGKRLAEKLTAFATEPIVVVALPRGGAPVGFEISKRLGCPLDLFVVKKIGAPQNPELALGAITEDGTFWWNNSVIDDLGISDQVLASLKKEKFEEAARQAKALRGDRLPVQVQGRTVVLVDDGLATGATALAAAELLKKRGATRIVLAVPVSSPRVSRLLRRHVDDVITVFEPENLHSVGSWYKNFDQVTDDEVLDLLRQRGVCPGPRGCGQEVVIPCGLARLPGELNLPKNARALVLFVHGSGSNRKSPRNFCVAHALNEVGIGTLMFDLLTPEETHDGQNLFNIRLMTERTVAATRWARAQLESHHLPLAYFGSSTGAAAALCAASEVGGEVFAVVSRGGRPDLASHCLARVSAPTLLIVGGNDPVVMGFNRHARTMLSHSELVIVPHAGHLFEEAGALEKVTEQSQAWFLTQLAARQHHATEGLPVGDSNRAGLPGLPGHTSKLGSRLTNS